MGMGRLLSDADEFSAQIPQAFRSFIIPCLRRDRLHKRLAIFLLTVAPAPVDPRLAVLRISNNRGDSFTGQFLRDIPTRNIFLEPGKYFLEQGIVVAEQRCISDAARV